MLGVWAMALEPGIVTLYAPSEGRMSSTIMKNTLSRPAELEPELDGAVPDSATEPAATSCAARARIATATRGAAIVGLWRAQ
eukprot:COSAG04_NODE_731_length_10733_cov_3.264435_6_plen_82_part_00